MVTDYTHKFFFVIQMLSLHAVRWVRTNRFLADRRYGEQGAFADIGEMVWAGFHKAMGSYEDPAVKARSKEVSDTVIKLASLGGPSVCERKRERVSACAMVLN